MNEEIKQFLELIQPHPGYKVLEVTSHADGLSTCVGKKLQPYDGQLELVLYPGEHESVESDNIAISSRIDDYAKSFRAAARSHDIVILRDILDRHIFAERILKLAYSTLANAAYIIVIQRKGSADIAEMMEQLDKNEFRASNSIDIFADSDLVMAKKMHMWGNGL